MLRRNPTGRNCSRKRCSLSVSLQRQEDCCWRDSIRRGTAGGLSGFGVSGEWGLFLVGGFFLLWGVILSTREGAGFFADLTPIGHRARGERESLWALTVR